MSPLPEGTRFRVKTTKSGKRIRLAFKKGTNRVIEAKALPKKDNGFYHNVKSQTF